MKKILVFLTFLSLSLGAAAQDNPWQWNRDDNSGAQDRTVIFADLVVDGNTVDINGLDSHYLIGAFIDGQCRGLAETVTNSGKQWLQIEVFGNYGKTDDSGKPISFRLYDKDSANEYLLSSSREVVWNQATYGMPSADHVVLSAWTTGDEAVITFPDRITLSKLHDVQATFTHVNPNMTSVDPAQVAVTIANGPHGWTAATATGNGLQWTMRGMAVGEYDYYVTYGGKRMLTNSGKQTGKLVIPAEVGFENGWDWISFYVPTSYALVDATTGDYLSSLNVNSENQVIEIRSQQGAIYNDPKTGIFGDITQLTAADGAYKIKSTFDDSHEATKVFNLGTTVDGTATAAMMPMVEPGYTWIGYPHEQNHTLATLKDQLSATATEGDRIIGHGSFIEFNGVQWLGSLQVFEAGKGYIYYTENASPFRLNWGDYYLPQEPEAVTPASRSPWHYDRHSFATNMSVVASLPQEMQGDGDRYVIGAFVGDECRGYGETADGDRLFITISGTAGEKFSLRLYDRETGRTIDVKEKLNYRMTAGSLANPMTLHTTTQGIEDIYDLPIDDLRFGHTYDLRGYQIDNRTSANRKLHIIPVSDGTTTKTIKIIK